MLLLEKGSCSVKSIAFLGQNVPECKKGLCMTNKNDGFLHFNIVTISRVLSCHNMSSCSAGNNELLSIRQCCKLQLSGEEVVRKGATALTRA